MTNLPVIVSFGGYNAAGRSSFHQAYQRMVLESLSLKKQEETILGLAVMMGRLSVQNDGFITAQGKQDSAVEVLNQLSQEIRDNTLIRPIGSEFFDVNRVPKREKIPLGNTEYHSLQFLLTKRKLPTELPKYWKISDASERYARIDLSSAADIYVDSHTVSSVQSAGQLPQGFDPASMYNSRFHPRALQLAIIGASDAVNASGLDWDVVLQHVAPDQISSYSSSVMSQLDGAGYGGLLQARLNGERISTKQLPLGMGSMVSDFVNAYVIGNLGSTGSISGACASFLYNLNAGIEDIRSGRSRIAVISSSEAPILPEVIEGYNAMGALATVDKLKRLDGGFDLRRSSRPFGDNCGFVIAESTQHIVLMDDELALALGAQIHGSVADVFINADGYKKSISAPGPGNYLTLAKAVASMRSLLGDEALMKRSFIQAHGSSTPQNRVTESRILDRVAETFGISSWPITAVKAFVGHSLGPASGDQLVNSLGIFNQGILPGIKTIDSIAEDVEAERLSFACHDRQLDHPMDVVFLNSKGFGGNNATASVLSPQMTTKMLTKRHGERAMSNYKDKLEATQEQANGYHESYLRGDYRVKYHFGEQMLAEDQIELDDEHIQLPKYGKAIDLSDKNPYSDMLD